MTTPAFMQAVIIAYESMTFDEVMRLPSSQRIAMMRIREQIKRKLDAEMSK